MLKAITLYEPWASLMAIGAKVNETRPVRTTHRGDIAIHAAKVSPNFSEDVAVDAINAFKSRGLVPSLNTLGCILAIVDVWDVQPADNFFRQHLFNQEQHKELVAGGMIPLTEEEYVFGGYAPGRWIYRTRNLRRLKNPVPTRGYQSIGWTVPPDIEASVRAELCPHDTDGDGNCPIHPKGCFR